MHMEGEDEGVGAGMELDRIISHACRELNTTPKKIGERFGIEPEYIEHHHIAQLWKEKLATRGRARSV
jgi:hypothetical protein